MVTRVAICTLTFAQTSSLWTPAPVARVHEPGPCSGTVATGKADVSRPPSAPLETLALGASATGSALEFVALT